MLKTSSPENFANKKPGTCFLFFRGISKSRVFYLCSELNSTNSLRQKGWFHMRKRWVKGVVGVMILCIGFVVIPAGIEAKEARRGQDIERFSHTARDVNFFIRLAPGATFPTEIRNHGEATVEKDFWIAETPVTYELWYEVKQWAKDNGYEFVYPGREGSSESRGERPTDRRKEPVTEVSWYDCVVWTNALSEFLGFEPVYTQNGEIIRNATEIFYADVEVRDRGGFRLPTSHEWELAARYKGSESSHGAIQYPKHSGKFWTPGNYASGATDEYRNRLATGEAAWYVANSEDSTRAVGQKPPLGNWLGLFDMSGNVSEWCFTPYDAKRILRGGSWNYSSPQLAGFSLQVGFVRSIAPSYAVPLIGFRVVRTDL